MTNAAATIDGRGTPEAIALPMFRRAMVRAAERALEAPYFSLRASVDVTAVVAHRATLRDAATAELPSLNDYFVRAVGLSLREHPILNATYVEGQVLQYPRVNVAVAIAIPGGLVAPAVYDVDTRDVIDIGREVRRLAGLARSKSLSREMIHDGTFTVSNLGMYGVVDFDPLLNSPQAAILGIGAVNTGERKTVRLSLGCDHRVLTGAEGAQYLQTLCGHLASSDDASALFWIQS